MERRGERKKNVEGMCSMRAPRRGPPTFFLLSRFTISFTDRCEGAEPAREKEKKEGGRRGEGKDEGTRKRVAMPTERSPSSPPMPQTHGLAVFFRPRGADQKEEKGKEGGKKKPRRFGHLDAVA